MRTINNKFICFITLLTLILSAMCLTACNNTDDNIDNPSDETEMDNEKITEILHKVADDANIYVNEAQVSPTAFKSMSPQTHKLASAASGVESFTKKFVDAGYFTGTKQTATNPSPGVTSDNTIYSLVVGACYTVSTLPDFKQKKVYSDPILMFRGLENQPGYAQMSYTQISSTKDYIDMDFAVVVTYEGQLYFTNYLKAYIYPVGDVDYIINVMGAGDMTGLMGNTSPLPYIYVVGSAKTANGVITEKLMAQMVVDSHTLKTETHINDLTAQNLLDYGSDLGWYIWGWSDNNGENKGIYKRDFNFGTNLTEAKNFTKMVIVECGANYTDYNSYKNKWNSTTLSANNKVYGWYIAYDAAR